MKNNSSKTFYKELRQRIIACRISSGLCYEQIASNISGLSPTKIFKIEYGNEIKNLPLDILYNYLHAIDCDIEIKITQHIRR